MHQCNVDATLRVCMLSGMLSTVSDPSGVPFKWSQSFLKSFPSSTYPFETVRVERTCHELHGWAVTAGKGVIDTG